MRGDDEICGRPFSYIDLEDRVRADHPLRSIREIANAALAALSGDFAALYSGLGRPSVQAVAVLREAPEQPRLIQTRLTRLRMHQMEAILCFIGYGLMENRSGLLIDSRLTRVSGHAERLAALDMVQHHADRPRAVTLGADRAHDAGDFIEELRTMNVRPHVAQNTSGRHSAIDRRTTRHPGYAASQRIRKRIEEAFGWIKSVAGLRQTKLRGLAKVDWAFTFAAAAYDLVRLPKLIRAAI